MAGAAQAASLTQTFDIPEQATDFPEPFDFDIEKFDTSLGTLQEVLVTLDGSLFGLASVENTSPSPANVVLTLQGLFDLDIGGLNAGELTTLFSETVQVDPGQAEVFSGLEASDAVTQSFAAQDDLFALFLGTSGETVSGQFDAEGLSSALGPGNVRTEFELAAAGAVTVQYVYEPAAQPVPEPGTIFGIGVTAAAGWLMKRKKSQEV